MVKATNPSLLKLSCAVLAFMVVAAPHAEAFLFCLFTLFHPIQYCEQYLTTGLTNYTNWVNCCDRLQFIYQLYNGEIYGGLFDNKASHQSICSCVINEVRGLQNYSYTYSSKMTAECNLRSFPFPVTKSFNCSTLS
ncbi:hypothetical protein Nepgr_011870 [Nepenthes gracilis]|uniref:Uncharacterized protein n=1 Tax=Nepenthes gracilis TaxID=150966 RepID=A0AAD3SFX5_NEPGR|nr:hypothetical protein Nepgr_011870 [Nepenthes gracilis]